MLLYKFHFRHFVDKLVSKWDGPHTICDIYGSGAIRFEDGVNGKPTVVNGQRLKHYIAGDPIEVEMNVVN